MPLFRYQAVSSVGKTSKGVIDADSLAVAKERLRKQRVLVTSVTLLQSKQEQLKVDPTLLLSFTKEIAQLLRAGLPLYESLVTIEEKYQRHKLHPLFFDLCDHLKEGASLSSALKKYPASFDQIYLSMVKVGEESGNLAAVFEQLAQLITRQHKLKKQLSSAFAYPSFLALFCFFIVCGLLFFVIPSMKELFEDRQLHPVTTLILGVSNWVNTHVLFLGLSLGSMVAAVVATWKSKRALAQLYPIFLKIPFVKALLLHSALTRFFRSLSMLLSGGVPLLQALEFSKAVVKSPLLEESIQIAHERVLQGERLSVALKNAPLMPPLVLRMLALSEETGRMQDAFFNLSQIYDEEIEKHLSQLNTFLQPALLITLGAIVGLVVLSILLPLTDMSSFTDSF